MYKLGKLDKLDGKPTCIFNLNTNTSIPLNPENTDYQEYLKWLEEGNTPLPADEENN